jgi:hypothetical protein
MLYDEWSGYSVVLLQDENRRPRPVQSEGVPPGTLVLSHRLSFPRQPKGGIIPNSQQTHIQVQAGQTTQITLGGKGWKVVGKVKVNGPERSVDWKFDVQWFEQQIGGTARAAPKGLCLG